MAWKKLAFTDEMLTNPMTEALDMAAYQIRGISNLKAYYNTGIEMQDSNGIGAAILATTSYSFVANRTVDMNDNIIESINSLKAHDALGIAVFDSGDSDRLVLCPTGYGFLTNAPVDMNKQEIEAMCFENLASAPATPGAAQIYYDTVDDHLYVNVV